MKQMLFLFLTYSILVLLESATVTKCTCDELRECGKEVVGKLDGCVNNCQTYNTSAVLNGILQCIKPAVTNGVDCIEQMNRQFCTNEHNSTINPNDVLEIPGTGIVRKLMHEKMLKAVDQPNSNALNILNNVLNSNQTNVQQCLNECVQKASVVSCLKQKGCSLQKPDTITMFSILPLCRQLSQQSNDESICPCIKKSNFTLANMYESSFLPNYKHFFNANTTI